VATNHRNKLQDSEPFIPKDPHSPGPYAAAGAFMLISKAARGPHLETIASFCGDNREHNRRRVLAVLKACDGIPTEILEHPGCRVTFLIDDVMIEGKSVLDRYAERDREREEELCRLRTVADALIAWEDGTSHPLLDPPLVGVRQLHPVIREVRALFKNRRPGESEELR
jgi:hypothetical protein